MSLDVTTGIDEEEIEKDEIGASDDDGATDDIEGVDTEVELCSVDEVIGEEEVDTCDGVVST